MKFNKEFWKSVLLIILIAVPVVFTAVDKWKKESEQKIDYYLLNVIDWDTILVSSNWENKYVRMIWIDAPESSTKRTWSIECYWLESKNYLKKIIWNNKNIKIELDQSQWKEDMYWRLLWYIWLNEENLNRKMIEDWYWYEYTFKGNKYRYWDDFIKAEDVAMDGWLWLWRGDGCSGKRKLVN